MIDRPNVLFIISDQQRPDTMGWRGQTPCRTPSMDRLAAEGISFDRAMTPCPLCLPARAATFTGLYPHENQMLDNKTSALRECQLLETFREGGYEVNYAGKWHLGHDNIDLFTDRNAGDSTKAYTEWCLAQGLKDGWTFNDPRVRTHRKPSMSTPLALEQDLPVDKTNDAYIADIAIGHLQTRDRSRPFFQVCSFNGPHPPFVVPEPYFSMYDPMAATCPANFGPQPGEPDANKTSYYRQLFLDHGEDFDSWRKSYAVYWGFTTLIDDQMGRLLRELEAQDILDDTIVLFMSDHGENLGAHGLWHKMVAYEESIRVPLVMRLPAVIRGGQRSCAPVTQLDIAPTLAGLCGLPGRPEWRGIDLSKLLAGEDTILEDRPLFGLHKPLGEWMQAVPWRMVTHRNFKYVWNRGDRDELFDLNADPFETTNGIDDPGLDDVLGRLQRMLEDFMRETDDPYLAEFKAEIESSYDS
ncbi:sulfatase-like hydrolase/transferase [uncultured Nitratireductor sp.]|uniref:sulfatase-like hydrolase/transferase n=1 Tax=uncultured Nitratireductor sp. TaxID=520953 RepID=UPI0025F01E37|nr:sulfatase-like hydrolase/transferase [uncultured Nitratireductor sp.]